MRFGKGAAMRGRVSGNVALLTGAARGQGRADALRAPDVGVTEF
jgi:hypothetical protein